MTDDALLAALRADLLAVVEALNEFVEVGKAAGWYPQSHGDAVLRQGEAALARPGVVAAMEETR